jgi:hypothetical protein
VANDHGRFSTVLDCILLLQPALPRYRVPTTASVAPLLATATVPAIHFQEAHTNYHPFPSQAVEQRMVASKAPLLFSG